MPISEYLGLRYAEVTRCKMELSGNIGYNKISVDFGMSGVWRGKCDGKGNHEDRAFRATLGDDVMGLYCDGLDCVSYR